MKSIDFPKLKDDFDQNGYVAIPGFLSQEEVQELNEKVWAFIRNVVPTMPENHAFFEVKNDPSSLKQLFHLSDYDPFFSILLNGSRFEKLAEHVLGEKIAKGDVEYFNKPPGIGKPTPPHQDAYYFMLSPPQAVTFWIPLEDVDLDNGCLRYVKGSHRLGMRLHGKNATLGFSQTIVDFGTDVDRKNEVAVPAKAGDVLAHHGMTIHRADGNNSLTRSRRVIGLVYFGVSAKEDLMAKEAYLKNLAIERQTA
ncbi:phytanoyl-CoA dioxygenase family protein [Spirosoma sp. BT702]|uniref:Phytanoyl-CoA dioxygenase family protein n=1 Tax=Spirosoma profusum TaxID=2771354 RepID=A0A926Y3L6_9BACT|nr:phytanoyl-CoA dioxygenase family protein [Spirosoma profusum]MBD2703518.1 phytanoyl-CoA dioxygenase family protein [Spirosoma profusum]